MRAQKAAISVAVAFEQVTLRISINNILPLRDVTAVGRKSSKYRQIAASIEEVGIIEPPVVIRDRVDPETFHLLDGHLRLEILKSRGDPEVVCLVATEDEAFTYNRRISRIATIQEHKMILHALSKGVSEQRLARALNLDIASIRARRNLLSGICPEAADLLRDKHVPINTFTELRRLKPIRQIVAAEIMIAMNRYTTMYAKSIVAASPQDQLVGGKRKAVRGLTEAQIALMERESTEIEREFRLIEQSYGSDHLDLVLATGYVTRLLNNARIVRHLAQHHATILHEFQKISDIQMAA